MSNDLTNRCQQIIAMTDGLDGELQPYFDLYADYIESLPENARGKNFWSYVGPHRHMTYNIDWEMSNNYGINYQGTDSDGDRHDFVLPFDFIENAEAKATEMAELKRQRREDAEAHRRAEAYRLEQQETNRRCQLYENLKKEFGE